MSSTPVLMVLYSNDAVEVRYADQSCLQLAACGSTFVHHESPSEIIHPAHGMKTISQRCEFATSDYKKKVIQALDFRNRFAERPFVCKDLIPSDQIVALYASVTEVAWPKNLDEGKVEYLPDGGVRLLSADEFSSIVLSPHRQDFTVCYLSQISTDASKKKTRHARTKRQIHTTSQSPNSVISDERHGDSKEQSEQIGNKNTSDQNLHQNNFSNSHNKHSVIGVQSPRSEHSFSKEIQNELNISPISMVSSLRSPQTSPENQEERKNFNRYSTPTDLKQNDNVDIGGVKSAFKYYRHKEDYPQDGSFLETLEMNKASKTQRQCNSEHYATNQPSADKSSNYLHKEMAAICKLSKHEESSKSGNLTDKSITKQEHSLNSQSSQQNLSTHSTEQDSRKEESTARCLYAWVTRHFSCDECPVVWQHPLNIARALISKREEYERNIISESKKMIKKKKESTLKMKYPSETHSHSYLPSPIPLTCPAQHLHKLQTRYIYDDEKSSLDNLTTFKQGKMKVLMVEGVIFRILRLSSTKVLEIFPGDGSVIISQGVTGHYYKHIIPFGDKGEVEERSYSIKSLPPTNPKGAYSVEKLVKRANRFLIQANQEEKSLTNADVCCWKQQSVMIEPLPTTLLEECSVPGYGRFTAFSSGHVRIVFEDRTSLDMTCDFSKRVDRCFEHSEGIHSHSQAAGDGYISTSLRVNTEFKQGFCKLLLPNGHFQVVDVKQPGLYRKYTDAALEWGSWVNSLPSQRKDFYLRWQQQQTEEQMVQRELQKIKCFNYIVDHTGPESESSSTAPQLDSIQSHSRSAGHHTSHEYSSSHPSTQQSVISHPSKQQSIISHHVRFAPSVANDSSRTFITSSFSSLNHHDDSRLSMSGVNVEMIRGFESVREALLKTSKVINDIDDILDKRKS